MFIGWLRSRPKLEVIMNSFKSVVVALTLLASPVFAVDGSQCGLTDQKDDSWKQTKLISLSRADEEKVSNLDTKTKQQIIIAANYFGTDFGATGKFKNTMDAVNFMRGNSEAGDMAVIYYRVNGERFTEVIHYPGGNPVGVIFATGSRTIIAENGDDSIICK